MPTIPSAIPMEMELQCGACGHRQPYRLPTPSCEACGHDWMDVLYDYGCVARLWPDILQGRPFTMWRYRELLPLRNDDFQITMGEGGTALLRAHNLGMMLGAPNVLIKDERQNPTNSFKDRQAGLVISLMKETGVTELVVASTGNVAISYSAYSTHAGIKLWTFLPSRVPQEKMREIAIYGSEVVKVTDTYDATKKVASEFAAHKHISADRGIRDIGTREAMKTLGLELAEQLAEMFGSPQPGVPFRAPDWYIQSVSGGMGPVGVWKGFEELYKMGLVDKLPKLALIQAEGCAPMVNSWRKGLAKAEPVLHPSTRVITIATGAPGIAYEYLYRIVQEHGGTFESVTDEETYRALHVVAKMEGLSIETAAAAAFAGLFKLMNDGTIGRDETVVVNCSGHTFPVEKFLLEKDWVKIVSTDNGVPVPVLEPTDELITGADEEDEPQGGLLGALDNLDQRIRRIAIVEDNRDAARLLRRILQVRGDFQISEAYTGKDGLAMIEREHPDLVLLDLMMPDMDGFELLDELEANGMLEDLPVIVISAKELTREDRLRLSGQIRMLLQKGSFMDEDLLAGIAGLLGENGH